MYRWIINKINNKKIKQIKNDYDPATELAKLINSGFSQTQALAIINAIFAAKGND